MSLSIRKNSKGRALHATAPHPPAKRLASYTNPILAIPTASSRRETCAWCLRNDRPVTACTGCRACSYCSKTCQRAAWKESHKLECPALGHVPSGRELPTPVRALLRVVVKAEAWGAVLGLAGNEGAFREERGRWEDLRLQGGMVRRLLGKDPAWVGGGDVVEKYAVVMCKVSSSRWCGSDRRSVGARSAADRQYRRLSRTAADIKTTGKAPHEHVQRARSRLWR